MKLKIKSKKRTALGVAGLSAIGFPLLAMIAGIVFSPLGVGVSSGCTIFSQKNCNLVFNTNATIVLSTSGYSFYSTPYQTCQQLVIGTGTGTTPSKPQPIVVPILGWFTSLPLISNVFDFFASIGGAVGNALGGTNGGNIQSTCSQQVGNLLVFHYTGTDFVFLLIGAVVSSAAIAALAGISFVGSGQNSAGTYIVFMISSMSLLWLILSSFAYPTFAEMPPVIGGAIYTVLTFLYAIGMLDMMS